MKKIFITTLLVFVSTIGFSDVIVIMRPLGGSWVNQNSSFCLFPNTTYEVAIAMNGSDLEKACACIIDVDGASIIGASCKDASPFLGLYKIAYFTVRTGDINTADHFSVSARSGCNASSASPSSSFGNYGSLSFNICNYHL